MFRHVGRRLRAAALPAFGCAALLAPLRAAIGDTADPAPRAAAASPRAGSLGAVTAGDTPPVAGVVKDSAGAPIPNVQVIITSLNRVTTTNAGGSFVLRGLPAGSYHLAAVLIGYAPGHADVVVPVTGDTVQISIVMRPAALQLSGVQVTATPIGTDPRNVTQSATELSGQALARNLAPTVAQSLENEPGVSVRYNGPAATAPVIRGLQGERILVLQDGDRAGDLSSAAPDHGVSIDPLTAQRIEVVRGPASLLYGNSALGGVVNVISNDIPSDIPSHIEGYVAGQTESATPGGAVAGGVTIPVGSSFALVARGGGRHADDLREGGGDRLDNSYFRNYYGVGGFGFGGSKATGGLVYRGYGFDYGLPSAEGEGAHIEGTRHEVAGRTDINTGMTSVGSVRVAGTGQWYQHDEVASTGAINTSFDLKTQTVDALARTRFGAVTGALGASGLFKQYASTGEEALTPAANSTGGGAFFYEEIPLGSLSNPDALVPRLQFGGRYDAYRIESKDSDDPKFGAGRSLSFNNASGSVGVSIPLGARASFAASAARAFRAPTVEELFSNAFHEAAGTFDKGNPDLEKEINQGFDGILRLQSGRVNGQVAGFYSTIKNFITPNIVKDTLIDGEDGPETVPLNQFSQGDATLKGFEGRVDAEVIPHFVIGAMGDLVRGELKDSKEPLPFMPPARLGALARWDNGRYSLGGEVRHGFEQNRVPAAVSDEDPSGLATDAYTVVNLSAGLNLPFGDQIHAFTLRVDNIGNTQYRDATSRIKTFAFNPGRNVSLVYRVLF
jgi:iron complex outermembrane recepter protein